MEPNDNSIRDRLLSESPSPGDLADYRQQVSSLIEASQRRLRRERLLVTAFWIFCAVSATSWLWFSADAARLPRGPFLACIFFTWGGVEVVKHYLNAVRLDMLKEIKQIQVQLFTLQADAGVKSAGNEPR
jgi:hypothetical protein